MMRRNALIAVGLVLASLAFLISCDSKAREDYRQTVAGITERARDAKGRMKDAEDTQALKEVAYEFSTLAKVDMDGFFDRNPKLGKKDAYSISTKEKETVKAFIESVDALSEFYTYLTLYMIEKSGADTRDSRLAKAEMLGRLLVFDDAVPEIPAEVKEWADSRAASYDINLESARDRNYVYESIRYFSDALNAACVYNNLSLGF